jgi:AraC-type DNA-binding domain-containing proteins
MCLTTYEEALMQEIYEYNRIPLWIYNREYHLIKCFCTEAVHSLEELMSSFLKHNLEQSSHPDFEIIACENELYYSFSFERSQEVFYLLAGPMLLSGFYTPLSMRTLSFAHAIPSRELEFLLENLPAISLSTFIPGLRITMLLLGRAPLSAEEISNYSFCCLKGSLEHNLFRELFENREDYRLHTPYSHEIAVLNCIREGDAALLEATYRTLPAVKYGNMSGSNNPLRQLFYGCIANTTLATRYAIEGGLEEETAFTLSDVYIKKMEKCQTLYELDILNEKMALDFTEQVAKAKAAKHTYSEPVTKCIDYIFKNIYKKITLTALAEEVHLSPKYLSCLFGRETGQTLSSYIEDKRLTEAKNLLVYSQYSFSEISSYLSYNTQSYFIFVFKKKTGMTPKEYRRQYASASWEVKTGKVF